MFEIIERHTPLSLMGIQPSTFFFFSEFIYLVVCILYVILCTTCVYYNTECPAIYTVYTDTQSICIPSIVFFTTSKVIFFSTVIYSSEKKNTISCYNIIGTVYKIYIYFREEKILVKNKKRTTRLGGRKSHIDLWKRVTFYHRKPY